MRVPSLTVSLLLAISCGACADSADGSTTTTSRSEASPPSDYLNTCYDDPIEADLVRPSAARCTDDSWRAFGFAQVNDGGVWPGGSNDTLGEDEVVGLVSEGVEGCRQTYDGELPAEDVTVAAVVAPDRATWDLFDGSMLCMYKSRAAILNDP